MFSSNRITDSYINISGWPSVESGQICPFTRSYAQLHLSKIARSVQFDQK